MNSKMLIGGGLILLVFNTIALFWMQSQQPKIAYIDTFQVFEGFDGKKELQNKLNHEMEYKRQVLDSMNVQIKALQESKNTEPVLLQNAIIRYQALTEQYQESYEAQNKTYLASIEKQITEYTSAYAKENGYDYVFGANGNGALLYAKEAQNITQDLIKFINQKYAGK